MQKDLEDMTPLHLTTRHKSPKCLALLLKHMAPGEVDTQDRNKVKVLLILRQLLILRFVAALEIGFTSNGCVQNIICHKLFMGLQSGNINNDYVNDVKDHCTGSTDILLESSYNNRGFKNHPSLSVTLILVRVWIACAYVVCLPLKNFTFRI